jgi:hypothetical protein
MAQPSIIKEAWLKKERETKHEKKKQGNMHNFDSNKHSISAMTRTILQREKNINTH